MLELTGEQVRAHRVRAQQLDREHGGVPDTAVLDLGVQDTGPDGGLWALKLRGVAQPEPRELALVWTLRGAPHFYRRTDLPSVARAVEPFSDADAGKRIYDASKPLSAAGIGNLEALDAVASALRGIVRSPMVKGEVSRRVYEVMDEPYRRDCRPCNTRHLYEMTFRLAALRAGLELQPRTSPPVLQRIPRFTPARRGEPRHDVVRGYLHLLGPATPQHVAAFLDAPVADVKKRWPGDAVEVAVDGQRRWALDGDLPSLQNGGVTGVRLLGPYDLFLQARDRDLLVGDPAQVKALWPVLGRPGALLADGSIAGTWRPRQSGGRLRLEVQTWRDVPATALREQAERLAAHRGVTLTTLDAPATK